MVSIFHTGGNEKWLSPQCQSSRSTLLVCDSSVLQLSRTTQTHVILLVNSSPLNVALKQVPSSFKAQKASGQSFSNDDKSVAGKEILVGSLTSHVMTLTAASRSVKLDLVHSISGAVILWMIMKNYLLIWRFTSQWKCHSSELILWVSMFN